MFIIKATLWNETRRLSFEGRQFPPYTDVQQSLCSAFNLPSTTHTYWVDVLFYPDDAQNARIKFKQHVCDAEEYKLSQAAFIGTHFPAPALTFNVLLKSDRGMDKYHGFHQARSIQNKLVDIGINIATTRQEIETKQTLLNALEDKHSSCVERDDELGSRFWSERAAEKRSQLVDLQRLLNDATREYDHLKFKLESNAAHGSTLRQAAAEQQTKDDDEYSETLIELTAWTIAMDATQLSPFPPLDNVLAAPHRLHGRDRSSHGGRHFGNRRSERADGPPDAFRRLYDRCSDVVHNQSVAAQALVPTLVPTQEIKGILQEFLHNFNNQLVQSLGDAGIHMGGRGEAQGAAAESVPAPETMPAPEATPAAEPTEPTVPGAFVQSSDAQTQTLAQVKPASGLGKGGFRHKHIACDGCLLGIRGMRYKCEQCPDYDLCGSCLPLLHTSDLHPATHTFKAMLHRGLEERIKLGNDVTSEAVTRHPATCDLCSQTILGVRWKCLNCPDWDACDSCAATITDTHPAHSFVKLHAAADMVSNAARDARDGVRHPSIVCDGCDLPIRGVRYKCMHPECPDYDLCEKCEAKPVEIHPDSHPMLKIKLPLRVEVRSRIEDEVYTTSAMRHQGRRGNNGPHPCHRPSRPWGPPSTRLDAFGPRRGRHPHDHPWMHSHQAREHVTMADPVIPGAYRESGNIVDQDEEASASLASPIVPDNKSDIKVDPAGFEVTTEPEVKKEVEAPAPTTPTKPAPAYAAVDGQQVSAIQREPPTPLDIFTHVRHVTILPGTRLLPGTTFTKVWRLKHFAPGSDYAFDEVRLVLKSAGALGDACKVGISFAQADVREDDEIEVAIEGLKVPNLPGDEIVEEWRFEHEGVAYGQPLRLRVTVDKLKSGESSLAASSVILPAAATSPADYAGETVPAPVLRALSIADLSDALSSVHVDNDDDDDDDHEGETLSDYVSTVPPSTIDDDMYDAVSVRSHFSYAELKLEAGDEAAPSSDATRGDHAAQANLDPDEYDFMSESEDGRDVDVHTADELD
ncbi:hypothetical protein Q5752_001449 [Cryptotrichosporon argae]